MPELLNLEIVAPIPVGHRVHVRWLPLPVRNIAVFGLDKMSFEARPQEPLIHDLDTGVLYGPAWAIDEQGFPRTDRPVARELHGRVTRCVVTTRRELNAATVLEIEPDPAGYR